MAGIQPEREASEEENIYVVPRFTGHIEPNKAQFVVKIRKTPKEDQASRCGKRPDKSDQEQSITYVKCLLRGHREAVLPDNKISGIDIVQESRLLGGSNIFTAQATIFWIFADLRYQLARLGGAYGNFVEEGYCETFE